MAYNIKTKIGYVKIGYEKAKLQLEEYFKQEMEKLKPDEPEVINAEDIIYEPEIINDDDYEPDTDEEFIQNQYKF